MWITGRESTVHVLLLDPQCGNKGARLHSDDSEDSFLIGNVGQLTSAAWRIWIKKDRNEEREKNRRLYEIFVPVDFLHTLFLTVHISGNKHT